MGCLDDRREPVLGAVVRNLDLLEGSEEGEAASSCSSCGRDWMRNEAICTSVEGCVLDGPFRKSVSSCESIFVVSYATGAVVER